MNKTEIKPIQDSVKLRWLNYIPIENKKHNNNDESLTLWQHCTLEYYAISTNGNSIYEWEKGFEEAAKQFNITI